MIRAEAFNLTNHANFGDYDQNLGDKALGKAQQTLAPSLGGLNALYQIGGPRSLQLAGKFLF